MKNNKKERLQRLKFKLGNAIAKKAQLEIYSDSTTEFGLRIIDENDNEISTTLYEVEGYYKRENKSDKVLFSQPITDNRYVKDTNLELAKYDVILVIDTSYEAFDNKKLAFTSVLICPRLSKKENKCVYQQISQILEWDATEDDKPENSMYAIVIENIRLHNLKYNQNPSIAVIIDSDLMNIPYFNDRTKPIFMDYYLPENFYLFYASSDTGNENFQNKLMRICDNEAKKALQEYKRKL